MMSLATCLADTQLSSSHEPVRLLLLSAGWRLLSSSEQTSVLNTVTQLVFTTRHSKHNMPLLRSLHWL